MSRFDILVGDNRSISPVVGVVLLVGVTLVLSAIVGVYVLGISQSLSSPATAGVTVEENHKTGFVEATLVDKGTVDEVRVIPDSGANETPVGREEAQLSTAGESGEVFATEHVLIVGVRDGEESVLDTHTLTDHQTDRVEFISSMMNPPDESEYEDILDEMDGTGSESNPYVITNVHELQAIEHNLSAHYVLGTNIDEGFVTEEWFDGDGFQPIGDDATQFEGSLSGEGYEIQDIYINRPTAEYTGVFGYVGGEGEVTQLSLSGEVSGDEYVGAVAGLSEGEISSLKTDATVDGNRHTGGVVGYSGGELRQVSNHGLVIGGIRTGGITGRNQYGTVKQVENHGRVESSSSRVGGIAGRNYGGTITYSVNHGDVSSSSWLTGGIAGYHHGPWQSPGEIEQSYNTGDVFSGSSRTAGVVGYATGHANITYTYNLGVSDGAGLVGLQSGSETRTVQSYSTVMKTHLEIEDDGKTDAIYWDINESGVENSEYGEGLQTEEMVGEDALENMDFEFGPVWKTTPDYPELDEQIGA